MSKEKGSNARRESVGAIVERERRVLSVEGHCKFTYHGVTIFINKDILGLEISTATYKKRKCELCLRLLNVQIMKISLTRQNRVGA